MNDLEFDDLLRTARGNVPLPDSFRSDVWTRIASGEHRPAAAWLVGPIEAFVRPWTAVGGLAATVALGLWLGAVSAPDAVDAKVAYAESISPFIHSSSK